MTTGQTVFAALKKTSEILSVGVNVHKWLHVFYVSPYIISSPLKFWHSHCKFVQRPIKTWQVNSVSSNKSKGRFFFGTKRGRLFEGGDYLWKLGPIYFFYPIQNQTIVKSNKLNMGFFKVFQNWFLDNLQCQYTRRQNLIRHLLD